MSLTLALFTFMSSFQLFFFFWDAALLSKQAASLNLTSYSMGNFRLSAPK